MSRKSILCSLSIVAVGFTAACQLPVTESHVDSFFVAPVVTDNLADVRAVVVLTDENVPPVVDRYFHLDKYRTTGIQKSVREALAMSLGAAFESLEFAEQAPIDGYDVLLQPRVDIEKTGLWINEWHVRVTVVARDRDGNLVSETTAVGTHGYVFLPESPPAFRFALRSACQQSIPEVALSLERHFAL
jgi:hypothetical protein